MNNHDNGDNSDSASVSTSSKNELDNASDISSDSSSSKKSSTSTSVCKPKIEDKNVYDTKNEKSQSVNFNLSANKICEYVPEGANSTKPLPYMPTPIVRPPGNTGSVPRKDILFDLWQIIQKMDQGIGCDLEQSMIRRGFLKARFTRK